MIPTISFNNKQYPRFQSEWFAAQFAFPFATKVCHGRGYDIGCGIEGWALPGSIPIDTNLGNGWSATQLPTKIYGQVDYIFSSHCLEHVASGWFEVLSYWVENIKKSGTIFLYLPDYSQEYWRPWNNKKHFHIFTPQIISEAFQSLHLNKIFVSGVDLNNSFMAMAEV